MPLDDHPVRCDLVIEQTLGHVTHSKNLERLLPDVAGIAPRFIHVPFPTGRWATLPGFGNWTVRAGLSARRSLRRIWSDQGEPDVLFVHTQVPAVLLRAEMNTVPTVVSIDATPLQYDALGAFYQHEVGSRAVERVKYAANRRCFERAEHIITWSEWAKNGVVDGYGVAADRVTAISPGVDTTIWHRPSPRTERSPVRVLFVGGDFRRKGGEHLLQAFRHLRHTCDDVELHVVTTAPLQPEDRVVVHRGLTSNSAELIELYHEADIFCLPTLGDCLPMVLAEAAAAGLPIVSTDVGAIHEIVRDGDTGALVRAGDVAMLTDALRQLISDGERRRELGDAARGLADRSHDALRNAHRIAEIVRDVAERDRGHARAEGPADTTSRAS